MPKRRALSRFFLKASSKKLVRVILRSLYSFMMNSVACPDGSMISGYLRARWKGVLQKVTGSTRTGIGGGAAPEKWAERLPPLRCGFQITDEDNGDK